MKISKQTLDILRNFSQINQSITVEPGNFLSTKNGATNSIQARVYVEETFPVEFSLYDLNQFLSIMALQGDSDVKFFKNHLTITMSHGEEVELYYTDPTLIQCLPKKTLPPLEKLYSFALTSSMISMLNKACGIIDSSLLTVEADANSTRLQLISGSGSNNTFKIPLPPSSSHFSASMSVELFNILPGTYTVSVCNALGPSKKVPVFLFEGLEEKVGVPTYLVASEIFRQ